MFKWFPWLKWVLPLMLMLVGASYLVQVWTEVEIKERREAELLTEIEVGKSESVKVRISEIQKDAKLSYTGKKLVALTFDDGNSETVTPRILEILERKGTKATFFVLGSRVNAEILQRMRSSGMEIESHTLSHKNLPKFSREEVIMEITEAESRICGALGEANCISFVRPPYGAINNIVAEEIKVPMMGWSVDSLDWKSKNAEAVYAEVMGHVFDGAIVLMHDIYDSTADAVERIIDDLRGQGYTLVTVKELVETRKPDITTGILYGKFL